MSESIRPIRSNLHHTQFYRNVWESMPDLKKIRNDRRLIIPLDLDAHADLNKEVAMVPPLSAHMAARTLSLFRQKGFAKDPIGNLENYMKSIEQAASGWRMGKLLFLLRRAYQPGMVMLRMYFGTAWEGNLKDGQGVNTPD